MDNDSERVEKFAFAHILMVDRLKLDKKKVFFAKYSFISKRYADYPILLKSSFDTRNV